MSIITDYYKFERLPEVKSKTRLDCTISTKSYPELETLRNKQGNLFLYLGDIPENFKADARRKAEKCLTKGKSISSLYFPDVQQPLAYGDFKGTADAILIVFTTDYSCFELLVARGQRNNKVSLYWLLVDGEFSQEIETLRKQAVTEWVTA
jgi:hypothetical protein